MRCKVLEIPLARCQRSTRLHYLLVVGSVIEGEVYDWLNVILMLAGGQMVSSWQGGCSPLTRVDVPDGS